MRALWLLTPALLLTLATTMAAETAQVAASPGLRSRATRFIQITDGRLRPPTQHLHPGELLGWRNYSTQRARISFDTQIAAQLHCRTPGSFRSTGRRLQSGAVQAMQFASRCSLAPGRYGYQVELLSGQGASGRSALRVVRGTFIVR